VHQRYRTGILLLAVSSSSSFRGNNNCIALPYAAPLACIPGYEWTRLSRTACMSLYAMLVATSQSRSYRNGACQLPALESQTTAGNTSGYLYKRVLSRPLRVPLPTHVLKPRMSNSHDRAQLCLPASKSMLLVDWTSTGRDRRTTMVGCSICAATSSIPRVW